MERTPYMQELMTMAYPSVAIEALTGGFDGSLERCVAQWLRIGAASGHSEAEVLLQAAGGDSLKAAHLITSSKITTDV